MSNHAEQCQQRNNSYDQKAAVYNVWNQHLALHAHLQDVEVEAMTAASPVVRELFCGGLILEPTEEQVSSTASCSMEPANLTVPVSVKQEDTGAALRELPNTRLASRLPQPAGTPWADDVDPWANIHDVDAEPVDVEPAANNAANLAVPDDGGLNSSEEESTDVPSAGDRV